MTPIAHNIARHIIRGWRGQGETLNYAWEILSATFFDISSIAQAISDSSEVEPHRRIPFHMDYMFMPAPKVFLDYAIPEKRKEIHTHTDAEGVRTDIVKVRSGALITYDNEIYIIRCVDDCDGTIYYPDGTAAIVKRAPLISEDVYEISIPMLLGEEEPVEKIIILHLLNLINQAHAIDLTQKPVHKGLSKELQRIRKFPYQGSNTITLKPGINFDNLEAKTREARITGKRIYHFVRGHFKPTVGKQIASYWRGDKEIGIKPVPDYVVKMESL